MKNLITVYCSSIYDIFQVRINEFMTLAEFKTRIAKRFNTTGDNIVAEINCVKYSDFDRDHKIVLRKDLDIDEFKMVKIEFKCLP